MPLNGMTTRGSPSIGITIDVLARGPVHLDSCGRGDVDADLRGIVHPHFVFDDLGVESGGAKLLRHIVGRRLVFHGARHVRRLSQRAQVLFRKLGIRHGKKPSFSGSFRGGVTEAEDGLTRAGRFGQVAADTR